MSQLSASSLALLVQNVLNALLKKQAWARERLQQHAGTSFAVEYQHLLLHWQISPQGLLLPPSADQLPSVTLSIRPDKVHHLFAEDNLARMRAMTINGDVHLARTLSELAEHLRWDYEEDLAQLIGDVWAHRLVALLQTAHAQLKDSTWRLAENFAAYVGYEAKLVLTPPLMALWVQDVRVLRDDTERQWKRTEHIEKRIIELQRQKGLR